MIAFFGTPPFAAAHLEALLDAGYPVGLAVTRPDKPRARGGSSEPSPVSVLAAARGIPVATPRRARDPEFVAQMAARGDDLYAVVAYGGILPPALLAVPRRGAINLHASLLPRWRGAAPIQAAIAAGDRNTGITVMYMNEGLDTGDILLQRTISILPSDTGGALHNRLAGVAPETLLESLDLLAKGKAPRTPQDNSLATFAPKLKREDGNIDWSDPADAIDRKIRAFNPWPGAFMIIEANGMRNLKIFSATVVALRGTPGEILDSEKEFVIAAGKDALSLGDVQLEGKRRMTATKFLRGHRVSSS